jgi:hypothetical protein
MHLIVGLLRTGALASVTLVMIGCAIAPLQMELTPALLHVQPMPVAGFSAHNFRSPVAFGSWTATPVSGALAANAATNGPSAVRDQGGYRLSIAGSAATTAAACRTQQGSTAVRGGGFSSGRAQLNCDFVGTLQGNLRVEPLIGQKGDRERGMAQFGAKQWTIRSVNHFQDEATRAPSARYGYEISSSTRIVAAVQTTASAQVWLEPNVAAGDREQIAAVIMALLYFDPRDLDD